MIIAEKAFFDLNKSRNSSGLLTELEVPFLVFNAADEDEAIEAVKSRITRDREITVENMVFDHSELDQVLGPGSYKIRAVYDVLSTTGGSGSRKPEPTFSFDTGGGTTHMSQSLKTKGKYAASGHTAPDFGGAIEVDENDTVKGIDITTPIFNFNETHYFTASEVSTNYKNTLADLTGRVNNSAFRGNPAGTVLFLGAAGTRRGIRSTDLWEINFKFAVSPNKKNLTIEGITITEKEGWDYMWFRYEAELSGNSRIKKPVAAYVEEIYERRSFGALKIGTV